MRRSAVYEQRRLLPKILLEKTPLIAGMPRHNASLDDKNEE